MVKVDYAEPADELSRRRRLIRAPGSPAPSIGEVVFGTAGP